jgi:hypothetical protein
MRLKTIPLYAVLAFAACTSPNQSSNMTEDYTQYVNPFIGTDFTGNTYPGAQVPFGMVQLSPDNGLPGWDRISGYFYPDSTIAGFSHTHLSGTGAGELPDKCKEVFKLSYLHDMKNKDIADVMGISLRTVEAHMYKALKILREKLSYLRMILLFWL